MDSLEQKIAALEEQQAAQMADLKTTARLIVESISPANLLRSAIHDVGQSPGLKNTILDTALGIGAGYLGRKLYVGRSANIFKKVAGTALEFLVSNFVRNKMPEIRSNGQHTAN